MARPRVLLNCACSLDGKLAAPDGQALPLSDEMDWRRVHALRASVDAILVGVDTVLRDDPSLRVNEDLAPVSPHRKLLRVVLDSRARVPRGARALDGAAPTLVMHGPVPRPHYAHADDVQVATDPAGRLDLEAVLEELGRRGVREVLVEGGARVLRSFLQTEFVERWTLYQAPVLVGGQGPSIFDGRPSLIGRRLHVENVQPQGKGVLWTLRP